MSELPIIYRQYEDVLRDLDTAQARIAELESERDALRVDAETCRWLLENEFNLHTRVYSDRVDAETYRWLLENEFNLHTRVYSDRGTVIAMDVNIDWRPDQAAAHIDAAIRKAREGK